MSLSAIQRELRQAADPLHAAQLQRFFKTGPGQYGEGDRFMGIKVPVLRRIAREHPELSLTAIAKLLASDLHEQRLTALLILTLRFAHLGPCEQREVFDFYMASRSRINNWDLVDLSAPKIVGAFLFDKDKSLLFRLVRSPSVWERRIAIVATAFFIRGDRFAETLELSALLLEDPHPLIHKAVGWMLREVGKKDRRQLENFLKVHYRRMPRTMLRYAIEHLEEQRRQAYLKGGVG